MPTISWAGRVQDHTTVHAPAVAALHFLHHSLLLLLLLAHERLNTMNARKTTLCC
jgi:hypothetical protein